MNPLIPVPTAYVDESLHRTDGGVYVVAAAVVVDRLHDPVRDALSRVTPRGRRFHWRTEQDAERRAMLALLAELPAGSLRAYVAAPCPPRRAERCRRKCLEQLLVDDPATRSLVIESREPHNDAKDRSFIAAMIRAGACPAGLEYRHSRPHDEPLLWLADAVAGIVSAAASSERPGPLKALGAACRVVYLDP